VSSLSLFHRVPSYNFEGVAARRRRRRQQFVAFVAFLLSLSAFGGTVVAWAVELGFGGVIGTQLARIIG
jgi:hypothetical protein